MHRHVQVTKYRTYLQENDGFIMKEPTDLTGLAARALEQSQAPPSSTVEDCVPQLLASYCPVATLWRK